MFWQNCIGIDIQKHSLVLVYLKKNFKKISLAGQAHHSLEQDPYLKEKPGVACGYIQEFIKTHKIASPDIYLGISRELVLLREIVLPSAIKENLSMSLAYELEKYVPFPAEEVYFDCQVIAEDKTNSLITVLLVAVKRKDLAPYLDLIHQLGLGFSGIEISSTALTNQISGNGNKGTFLVAHQQEDGLEIICIRDRLMQFSRMIRKPPAGEAVGSFWEREFKPVKACLAGEIEPIPTYYYGGMDPVVEFLKQDPMLAFSGKKVEGDSNLASVFMAAMGAARKGIEKVPMAINLLPPVLRKKPSRTGYYILFGLTGLLCMALLLWGGGKVTQQRTVLARLDEDLGRLQKEVRTVERIKEESKQIETKTVLVDRLYREYPPTLEILRELSRLLPETAWIHDFTLNKRELQLNGTASSAAELIPLLEESSFFKDVVFLSPITRDKEGREEFRIGLKLE